MLRCSSPAMRFDTAGAIDRAGCNSEFHLVDERIVGRKPATLSAADAAALPLTGITAWELLFDRLEIARTPQAEARPAGTLLIVGAAGGVGSILIQLARQLTDLTVVATASRPQTQAWATELGAHQVIDHHQPMLAQLAQRNLPPRQLCDRPDADRPALRAVGRNPCTPGQARLHRRSGTD